MYLLEPQTKSKFVKCMAWHDISYLQYYWVDLFRFTFPLYLLILCRLILYYLLISLSRLGRGFPTPAFGWPHLLVVSVYYPMWAQVQVGMTVKRDLAIIKGRIKLSRSWRNDHRCWRNCSWISFSYWIFWVMILLWVLCLS